MRVLVATDSFKGSLTSLEAGYAIKEGILSADSDAEVEVMPLADGGEGTCFAIANAYGALPKMVTVTSPIFGREVTCHYAVFEKTAIIEMAACAGITFVSGEEKNPLRTTTYGVGEMIKDAVFHGCRSFIIGLGGSATNDGGVGMLQALGFSFTDSRGKEVPPCGQSLQNICKISAKNKLKELDECTFTLVSDVTNPLCGKTGCSFVFAKQKGATDLMIREMDAWMQRYACLTTSTCGVDHALDEGSGAAGGLGFAFLSFLGAQMQRGAEFVLEAYDIEKKLENTDVVVTGEGKMDGQTVFGKAPITIAKLAKNHQKRVLAFCGCTGDGVEACLAYMDGIYPIKTEDVSIEQSMNPSYAQAKLTAMAKTIFDHKKEK